MSNENLRILAREGKKGEPTVMEEESEKGGKRTSSRRARRLELDRNASRSQKEGSQLRPKGWCKGEGSKEGGLRLRNEFSRQLKKVRVHSYKRECLKKVRRKVKVLGRRPKRKVDCRRERGGGAQDRYEINEMNRGVTRNERAPGSKKGSEQTGKFLACVRAKKRAGGRAG